MKNQHFGDVNDYQKYGLLRLLTHSPGPEAAPYKIGVCWMLTLDEGESDSGLVRYLHQPTLWRRYDPALFDLLQQWVLTEGRRDVMLAPASPLLPGAKFYSAQLTDALRDRQAYFMRMRTWLTDCDLIFYDADNGIEVPSCPKGRQRSARYIYWDELSKTFANGHSVMVSQRFRREKRTDFIQQMVQEYQTRLGAKQVYWVRTKHQTYFLSAQEAQAPYLSTRLKAAATQWVGHLQTGSSAS